MRLVGGPLLSTLSLGLEVAWVLATWPPHGIFMTTWDHSGPLCSFISNASLRRRWEAAVRV